jgi:hypothetical protein
MDEHVAPRVHDNGFLVCQSVRGCDRHGGVPRAPLEIDPHASGTPVHDQHGTFRVGGDGARHAAEKNA